MLFLKNGIKTLKVISYSFHDWRLRHLFWYAFSYSWTMHGTHKEGQTANRMLEADIEKWEKKSEKILIKLIYTYFYKLL